MLTLYPSTLFLTHLLNLPPPTPPHLDPFVCFSLSLSLSLSLLFLSLSISLSLQYLLSGKEAVLKFPKVGMASLSFARNVHRWYISMFPFKIFLYELNLRTFATIFCHQTKREGDKKKNVGAKRNPDQLIRFSAKPKKQLSRPPVYRYQPQKILIGIFFEVFQYYKTNKLNSSLTFCPVQPYLASHGLTS